MHNELVTLAVGCMIPVAYIIYFFYTSAYHTEGYKQRVYTMAFQEEYLYACYAVICKHQNPKQAKQYASRLIKKMGFSSIYEVPYVTEQLHDDVVQINLTQDALDWCAEQDKDDVLDTKHGLYNQLFDLHSSSVPGAFWRAQVDAQLSLWRRYTSYIYILYDKICNNSQQLTQPFKMIMSYAEQHQMPMDGQSKIKFIGLCLIVGYMSYTLTSILLN